MCRNGHARPRPGGIFRPGRVLAAVLAIVGGGGPQAAEARDLTIRLVESPGVPVVAGFDWLVESDPTRPTGGADIPSLRVHGSHATVLQAGEGAAGAVLVTGLPDDPDLELMVSVMPDSGYGMSGAPVPTGASEVEVVVRPLPAPTAQISVFVFHDDRPINGAPDIPAEAGLAGFSVLLFDPAGQLAQDAFGNPLGTSYQQSPGGDFLLDAEGAPLVEAMGDGTLTTDANGEALIRFLAPGKYGVQAVPPAGQGWIQTSTIEGTHTIDAWVRAGEPPYFAEWGAADWHAFIGFVKPQVATGGTASVSGRVVYVHEARPPEQAGLYPGVPVEACWVGVNALDQADQQIHAAPCAPDSTFQVTGLPAGTYQLTFWDENLDAIIDFRTVTLTEGQAVALGDVAIFAWYGFFEGSVFTDANANGVRDPGEPGVPNQAVLLRYPDGSIYQAGGTDGAGDYGFSEVFPFFHWILAEVDFARLEATGGTFTWDLGGPLAAGEALNPSLPDTQLGPVLTQGMLLYAGQTNRADWGKRAWTAGSNGGISGIVTYATTRAENDPRFAVAEDWEPGIPRVPVALYLDADGDGLPDDVDGDGTGERLTWDRTADAPVDWGDAVAFTRTDSWDDALPTGCGTQTYAGLTTTDCAETLRTWNQLRPAVFDGGYAFTHLVPGGLGSLAPDADPADSERPLDAGRYLVEAVTPAGYELVQEEDRNVDFAEDLVPALPPPPCVGEDHEVPAELSLFPGIPAPFAGQTRPSCDLKAVQLVDRQNAAANFFFYTRVPKAARIWGMVLNDALLAFDPDSPLRGTNAAPSHLPVTIRDWAGVELQRVYTDQWGRYEALVPSTYSVSRPSPTGVSPNILQVCLNEPGPGHKANYQRICTNWDFWPGKTTRLDTPILPLGAFAAGEAQLACAPTGDLPVVSQVSGPGGSGPVVPKGGGTLTVLGAGFTPAEDVTAVLGDESLEVAVVSDGELTLTVPGTATSGQLMVAVNGREADTGITVHVDPKNLIRVAPGASIQAAIDGVNGNKDALILVPPGVWRETLFLYKNVALQGYGPGATFLEAGPLSPAELTAWDARLQALLDQNRIAVVGDERPDFHLERAPGILVAGGPGGFPGQGGPRVDGFTVYGATQGGGIQISAYAARTAVSNNVLLNNQGTFGGGIRVGTPNLIDAQGTGYLSSRNEEVSIHHNRVVYNGAFEGGGGISLFTGSDGYRVVDNVICGNYSNVYGGGLVHLGLSPGGRIADNRVVANQAFDEGGGVFLGGELPPAAAPAGTLSPGAGSVEVVGNLILGNFAGDDGGGLRTLLFNGQDVVANRRRPERWHALTVADNLIVNNVSADTGGGVSLDDAARVSVTGNTIAHNDSTATGIDAFGGPCNGCPEEPGNGGLTTSLPQVAGLASRVLSAGLAQVSGQAFSTPVPFTGNILYGNRAWYWDATANGGLGALMPARYWDHGVYGGAGAYALAPADGVLTGTPTGTLDEAGNQLYDGDPWPLPDQAPGWPLFARSFRNGYLATSKGAAFGNFVSVVYDAATFGRLWDHDYTPTVAAGVTDPPVYGGAP